MVASLVPSGSTEVDARLKEDLTDDRSQPSLISQRSTLPSKCPIRMQ